MVSMPTDQEMIGWVPRYRFQRGARDPLVVDVERDQLREPAGYSLGILPAPSETVALCLTGACMFFCFSR